MKTSSTKRMLAFWLAVAILGAPTSGAFAAGMTTLQPAVQAADGQVTAGALNVAEKDSHALKTLTVGTEVTVMVKDLITISPEQADTYSYAIKQDTPLPAGLQFDKDKKNISGNPTTADNGKFTITVTDSSKSVSQDVEISYAVKAQVQEIKLKSATVEGKTYDGTTKVDPDKIQVTFSGATSSPVTPAAEDYTVTGTYDTKDVGDKKTVTVTVELTEAGKKKYIFTGSQTTATTQIQDGSITPTDLSSVTVSSIEVSQNAVKTDVEAAVNKAKITATGVKNEPVTGNLKLTGVAKKSAENTALNFDTFAKDPGDYTITATFAPTGTTNYNPKTDVTFTCKVTSTAPAEKKEQKASFRKDAVTVLFGKTPEANELTITEGNTAGQKTFVSTVPTVATVNEKTGEVTVVGAGETTITATIPGNETYKEHKVSYTLTVNQADYAGDKTVPVTVLKNTNPSFDLPEAVGKLADVTITLKNPSQSGGSIVEKAEVAGKKLTVKTKADATGTEDVVLTVKSKNYKDFDLTYKLTAKERTNVSDNIQFVDKTFTHDGQRHKLDNAQLDSSVQPSGTQKWTYTYTQVKTKDAADPTKMPEFSEIGVYEVTATYEDDKNFGQKTATLTIQSKTSVSDKIQFADKTFTYDGKKHKLDNPQLTGVTPSGTQKWTYSYKKAGAADATDTTQMPELSEVGVYEVTATYQDDKHFGQKTATLKIEAPAPTSSITVTAEQRKGLIDENYKNFSISLRDESTGYIRIRADANDYLDRQKINDTYSEWIGLEITPKVNGSTSSIENFYVSTNGASWNKISKGTYGNFYLDGVQGYSFYLWYDTDDRDCADDLYLATDNMGANKFQIHVDFDSYSSSSDSGSSGSTSSSTDKVNGDKVSTTTIDKTPSVKGNSATVSISSSALSDALEKNKKESKHEHADKSFIELDVKTSKSVDDTTVTVPVKSLDKISDEDTGLSLVTNQGTIQLDYRALSKIVSAADKNEVSISIEEDKSNQYTLMVKDGSHEIIDLGSGEAELTFSYKLKSGEKASDVKVYRVGDGSKTWLSTYGGSTVYAGTGTYAAATGSYITNMNADYNSSKKKVTFATDALGTFLVTTDTLQTGGTSTPGTSYPSYPSYPSNSTFVDVPASRWSAQYINKLASLGVVNGTGGGYFEPTLYVTREEFVKMLAGVAGANVSGYTSQRFPDVSASRWSAPYIAWAVDHGITTGTDGGKFAPTMKITREEMATMIYRYTQSAGKVLPTKNVPTVFSDAHRIDSWAQTPVSVMQQAGIIDGNVVNGRYSFDPKVPATREECAKMLCLLYDLI